MFPTQYADVNPLLNRWLSAIEALLSNQIVGAYLHGSLAYGDFDPLTSDVDCLVITETHLDDATISALGLIHAELSASGLPYATNMECSYIPRRAIRRFDPADDRFPVLHADGRFDCEHHGVNWIIQRHLVRRFATPIIGEPIIGFIDPIPADVLRNAVVSLLQGWWQPMLQNPVFLHDDAYQAYGVLTMCRALYTLDEGNIISKPASAQWALGAHPDWASLIEKALYWKPPQPFDDLKSVLAFVQYTVARI